MARTTNSIPSVKIHPSAIYAAETDLTKDLYIDTSNINGLPCYTLKSMKYSSIILTIYNLVRSLFGLSNFLYGKQVQSLLSMAKLKKGTHVPLSEIEQIIASSKNFVEFSQYLIDPTKSSLAKGKIKFQRAILKIRSINKDILMGRKKGLKLKAIVSSYCFEKATSSHYFTESLNKALNSWLNTEGLFLLNIG